MSARRGSRLRRKPTPIYQVEDTRDSSDDMDVEAEEQDVLVANEQCEERSSDDGREGDDEEFTPGGTKVKTPKKSASKAARTPTANVRSGRRKRSPWSQTRSLQSNGKDRKSKINGATKMDETPEAGIDNEQEHGVSSLFDAVKNGKVSLENLLSEWRDRFEEDDENATREVLNLVLQACGGRGQCVPESEPLAQLNMADLVNHVEKGLEKANGEYPLMSRRKGKKKFQRHFDEFWEFFVKECYESEILFTSEIANNFIDWLTTLSSSELRPIRHTTTVAVLALSNSLVRTAASISEQLAIATRQLNAEMNSPASTPGAGKSPNIRKVALLKDNRAVCENRLQQVLKLVNLIFTGVVVHRYRDVMPEIRVATMQCLGHWITTLPDQFLKDSFLKYLGWLLSDRSAAVRFEVVEILCELYENDAFTEKLELFTARFLSRYLELCSDVDDGVVEEAIHLLIAVDKHSLISSDIELQPVEKLVFDAEHEDIRKAAAEFVCIQYDAFGVAVSKTKNATLKKEQLNTQAIALVEFAEEYIQNYGVPEDAVETLVDAFWGLEDCLVLQEWRVMTDLLLVDKTAPDLSSEQQTILLRLLVASVRKLVDVSANRSASAAAKRESEQLQEEITVAYCKDIPSLFLLYQADSDKLALLLELIPMLTLRSEVIGHHSSQMKELLEKLKHAYLLHSNEELLTSVSLSITHLLKTEHASLKREAEALMQELVQEIMDKTDRLLEADIKLFDDSAIASGDTPKARSKKAKGRKKKGAKTKEISDVEYGLRISLCRIKCLAKYLNIREYLASDLSLPMVNRDDQITVPDSHQGRMDKLVVAVGDLLHRRTKSASELDEGFRNVDTIKHSLATIYFDLLWTTAPIFKSIEEYAKQNIPSNAASEYTEAVDPAVQSQIQKVCQSRSTFEEALISVLEMHLARTKEVMDEEHKDSEDMQDIQSVESMEEIVFEDEDVVSYVKEAQRFAFLTFCDIRCLFVEKFQDATPPYDALEWALPNVLRHLTQMHFESEMDDAEDEEPEFEDDVVKNDPEVAEEKANALREWQEKQQRRAELLVALGRVALCNPNKKYQAAAVLQCFTSSGKSSVEVVKAFGKQVKTDAPVRYLEIQMAALRQLYSSILIGKQDIESAQTSEEKNDDDIAEQEAVKEKVESSELELKELAKRFSQSLGVGKVPLSLRAPFLRFLREGVRYALEQPAQFEFLEAMRVYVSRLDNTSMAQLREYFMDRLETLHDVPGDSEDLDSRWRAVFDFQTAITSTVAAGKRNSTGAMLSPPLRNKRRSASSEPTPMQGTSIAEEDEGENVERVDNAGEETESAAGDQTEANKAGHEEQIDHNNRHTSSGHKRFAVADEGSDMAESLLPRKRMRRSGKANEAEASGDEANDLDHQLQSESKSEEEEPPQSDDEVQPAAGDEEDDKRMHRNRRRA
ncbi:STAG domain-containing protein [Phytophthora infestans]|uniref:STAG domain-containing protein n=1 Tax=Phytophthora infestans TaxID=4787 RepID=A0A8S9VAT6_PHYIN|nr:STAG domain-containing protein [Phytophthora infestans]